MGDQHALQMSLNDYNDAVTLKSDFPAAYSNRGLLYYQSGNLRMALEDYETAIEKNICKLEKYNDYLQNTQKIKNISLDELNFSILLINSLREQGQDLREVLTEELYVELVQKLIEQINNAQYANYQRAGQICYEMGKYEQAEAALIHALDYTEENPALQYSLAMVYMQLHEYQKAIEQYRYCIEKGLVDYNLYTNLGHAYSELNLIQEALNSYSKAIELNPGSIIAYHNRIAIYWNMNDYESALSDIHTALKISPENTNLYELMVNINFLQENYKEAAANLSILLHLNERNGENTAKNHYERGVCYFLLGEQEKAKNDLLTALEKGYSDHLVYRYLGDVFSNLGDYQRAIDYYKKYVEKQENPDDYIFYILGVNYFRLEQYEMSVEALNKSIHYNPLNHESIYIRGLSYYYLGKEEEALRDFETSAALGNQGAKDALLQISDK